VILAPGSDPTGATVAATLRELAPKRIILVGGSAVVPAALAAALAPIAPVQRLSGADRFSTNAAVTGFAFQKSSTALVASGENFPDALAGAAWAGHLRVPLLLAHSGCLTTAIAAEVYALGTQTMTLLGGTGVVGDRIGRGVVC
jgi:putative cell wall-binding protein